jgi:hypothetical protein
VGRHTYVPSEPTAGFDSEWVEAYECGRAEGEREGFAIIRLCEGTD